MNIPKIVHQTWKTQKMPDPISKCVASLRQLNPHWEHRFYTDDDWESLITECSLVDRESFLRFPTGIQRADIFRAVALYEKGGVYADVDLVAIRPLDSMISAAVESGLIAEDTEMILATDHPVHSRVIYGGGEVLMNNFMISVPRARFLELYLHRMMSSVAGGALSSREPVSTTGPVAITQLIDEYGGVEELKIAVVPFFWTNPLPDMALQFPEWGAFDEILTDGSWRARFCPYLVHCWWHSYWGEHNMLNFYDSLLAAAPPNIVKPEGNKITSSPAGIISAAG